MVELRSISTATRTKETSAPASRATMSMAAPIRSASWVPTAATSPVGTRRGSEPPSRTAWRTSSCWTR